MLLKGFIMAIAPALDKNGAQRIFEVEGKTWEAFTAHLKCPRSSENGNTYYDEFVADIVRPRENGNVEPYKDYIGIRDVPFNLTVTFSVKSYQNRQFNSIRLSNVSINAK